MSVVDKSFTCYYITNLLVVHLGPCIRGFLSTIDVYLYGIHISLDHTSGALLGVGRRDGFYSHSVYNRLMAWLSSEHWDFKFLQGEFPTPWTFGKNLRTTLRSQGFLFSVFFV